MTDCIVATSKEWLNARLTTLNSEIARLSRLFGKDSEEVAQLVAQAAQVHTILRFQSQADLSFPHWADKQD